MKTKGKVAMAKTNDFDIVSGQLSDGLSRLAAARQNAKLSAEQRKAVDDAFRQIEVLQKAAKDCGNVERFAAPEVRNAEIGRTVASYDIEHLAGFADIDRLFGSHEMRAEREAARVDRDLAVNDLVSGIRGMDGVAEADYQGSYGGY